jgi:hypothetical protein
MILSDDNTSYLKAKKALFYIQINGNNVYKNTINSRKKNAFCLDLNGERIWQGAIEGKEVLHFEGDNFLLNTSE